MWISKVKGEANDKAKAGFATMFVPAAAVVVLLFSAVGQVYAQTEQGRWMAGGGLSGNVATDSNPIQILGQNFTRSVTNFSFNLSPQAGYFVAPDLAVGVGLGFGVNHSVRTNDDIIYFSPGSLPSLATPLETTRTENNWSMNLGPFVRYFFLSLAPTTKLFAQARINAGVGILTAMTETDNFNERFTLTSGIIQPVLTLGCAFFVSPNVSIEPTIAYERSFLWSGISSASSRSPAFAYTRELTPVARSTGSVQYGVGFQIYF